MELQLSSGQGPEECELAVGKLLRALPAEFPDLRVVETSPGRRVDCYRSVRIACESDLSFLEGSVKWICESPYRRAQKRKNWFVDVSLCTRHKPTGLAVTSTEARSQQMNKHIALNRLCEAIAAGNESEIANVKALNRLEHTRFERGNAVRAYVGIEFQRKM